MMTRHPLVGVLSVVGVAGIAMAFASGARPAQPVHEVSVVAHKFAFEPSEIQVAAGEPVRLVIRSADVVHGFAIRELKIDVKTASDGPVVADFTAPPPGRYDIVCSEFCGRGHAQMKAVLVSVAPVRTSR